MERQVSYQDFDLLIEPGAAGSYRARVLRSPAGEAAPVEFTLPFSPVELENFVLKVSRGRRRARGAGRPESAPLKEFGGKLYDAVFQHELHDTLQRSLSLTRAQHVGMRLRLRLADTPELAQLPWEFLYDPRHDRFLAQSRHSPLVRYLDLPDPPQPLSVQGPLRLLVMISSPSDYPGLDVEQEWNLLTSALAGQQAQGRVVIERLAASMKELRQRLRRGQFHVFHFVGHGRYRPDWGSGVLVMEDRHGRSHEVPGDELGGLLNEYDETRLAVLNACEGARSDDANDPFAGMAQSLIRQGLPAVVAMQFEITDDAAIIFAQELYGAIADGFPLEAALAEARGAIRDEGNLTEWGTPVLYSRAPDGRLFDVTRQARKDTTHQAQEQAEHPAREQAERAKAEAERQAREQAEHQAREQADRQAREQAEREAREQAEREASDLAARYALACAAADDQDWDQAIAQFTMIANVEPGYRDVEERAENARKRQQVVRWQAEAHRLYQAGQWAAVVKAGQQLHALDPDAADPDGLVTSARAELAAAQPADQLDTEYEAAQRLLDAGNWREAIAALEQVAKVNPAYRATPALLERARRQLAGPKPPPEAHSYRQRTGAHRKPSQTRPALYVPQPRALQTSGKVWSLALSPNGTRLATGGNGDIQVWDLQTGVMVWELRPKGFFYAVPSLAFSSDGARLVTGSMNKTAQIWDATTGQQQLEIRHGGDVYGVVFSPDGTRLATGSHDKTARIWDATTGQQQLEIRHAKWLYAVAFSPDGAWLATSADKTARIWDASTGQQQLEVTQGGTENAVAFSPDGTRLATGNWDKTARIWDASTGQQQLEVTHNDKVRAVAFSPDGTRLATGSHDKTARIWDASTGQQQLEVTHNDKVRAVAFSPDGTRLATGSHDQTARIWDVTGQ